MVNNKGGGLIRRLRAGLRGHNGSADDVEPGGTSANLHAADSFRTMQINNRKFNEQFGFADNFLKTSKYNPLTFICVNLYEQFKRTANFYFLVCTLMQLVPAVSPFPLYVTVGPMIFILAVTAVKEAFEDCKRHKRDANDGAEKFDVLQEDGRLLSTSSRNIRVGDILWLKSPQEIPADIILLSSNDTKGVCYVSTANLDGETSLKVRTCVEYTNSARDELAVSRLRASLTCAQPDAFLSNFNGSLKILDGEDLKSVGVTTGVEMKELGVDDEHEHRKDTDTSESTKKLQVNNFIPRGAKLMNTAWAAAVVVYTGPDTKVALNLLTGSHKFSMFERRLNDYVRGLFILQTVICLAFALSGRLFDQMWLKIGFITIIQGPLDGTIDFMNMFVLFSWMIPLSIYVTIEFSKIFQTLHMKWDGSMWEGEKAGVTPNTSDINEELGQVQFILTDKTGTLTQNLMKYSNCSIATTTYDKSEDSKARMCNALSNELKSGRFASGSVSVERKEEESKVTRVDSARGGKLLYTREYMRIITVNNAILVQDADGRSIDMSSGALPPNATYSSESGDEVALADMARDVGYQLLGRSFNIVKVFDHISKKEQTFEILAELHFSAEWKRQSCVVKTPEGEIWLYIKGADSAVIPLCESRDTAIPKFEQDVIHETNDALLKFSTDGLRTLVLAAKKLTVEQYDSWRKSYQEAATSLIDSDQMVRAVFQRIELGASVIGCSAVEDKLQDGCKETLVSLRRANIGIAMATGDKMETAVNIGYNVGLINKNAMVCKISNITGISDVKKLMADYLEMTNARKEAETPKLDLVIVADGNSVAFCLLHVKEDFIKLFSRCSTAIFCRMDPLQKSAVVRMVKSDMGQVVLAVGDGANDVSMILESSVGIGIVGKEGRQAAAACDYQILTFRNLNKLLLVHGRWCYHRLCQLVYIAFYCNVAFQTPMILYAFYSGYSGASLYPATILTSFNPGFALPIFAVLGVMDIDIKAKTCMQYPEAYAANNTGVSKFNAFSFFVWMILAIWQGCVVFFLPLIAFETNIITNNGYNLEWVTFGLLQFGLSVICHSLVSIVYTRYITIINAVVFIYCVGGYFFYSWFFSSTSPTGELGGILAIAGASASTFFTIILAIALVLLPHITMEYISRFIYTKDWHILQEREVLFGKGEVASDAVAPAPMVRAVSDGGVSGPSPTVLVDSPK